MCEISIIIPVYNCEKYIDKCLQSLREQTFKDFEVICVNDGSTDSSEKKVEAFVSKDFRFRLINQENGGASRARNVGIEHAKGQFIMFLDADDWYEKNACEMAYNAMISYNADVVMFSGIWEYSHKSETRHLFSDKIRSFNSDECKELRRRQFGLIGDELSEIVKFEYMAPLCFKIYKSSIIKENNLQIPNIKEIGTFEDGLFNIAYFKYVNVAVDLGAGLYHYRKDHETSVTTKYKPKFIQQWNTLFDWMEDIVEREKLNKKYIHALNNRIAYSIVGIGGNVLKAPSTGKEKKKLLKDYISTCRYKEAIKDFEIGKVPFIWRPLFIAAKMGWVNVVYLLLGAIRKIVKHRNK